MYIALDDLDFDWKEKDVETVVRMYNAERSITNIAKSVRREVDEVAILIMDLGRKGRITPRMSGALGRSLKR